MSSLSWSSFSTGRRRIYTQIVFWVIICCLYIVLKEYPAEYSGPSLLCLVLQETLELAIPCYTQTLLILPLFRKGKWPAGVGAYLVQIAALIFLLPLLLNFVSVPFSALFHLEHRADWRQEHIAFSMVAFTLVATAFRLAFDRLLLERHRRENELKQLKAQLNPHFLFNTLNNLYGLAVIKSDKLPTLMLKLSDLLRYSLYDTGQDLVPLEKELTYISDYVELEKIRLDEKTEIRFEIAGEVGGKSISPLILISFVENSFKHFSGSRNGALYVRITITLNENELHMKAINSLDPLLYLQKPSGPKKGGIGIDNVRQRLGLLYPQKHLISVTHIPECYSVDLKLQLSR